MSNPKQYTAKDIERYHHGEMTAAEMHQLEKAALNDPMLTDALEGYRYSQSPSAEMETLQNRLQERLNEGRQKNRVFWMQPWIRIAALFILLAGGGWLVFQTFSPRTNDLATSSPIERTKEAPFETAGADSLRQLPPALQFDSTVTTDIAVLKKKSTAEESEATQSAPQRVMKEQTSKNRTPEARASDLNQTGAVPRSEAVTTQTAAPTAARREKLDSATDSRLATESESAVAARQTVPRSPVENRARRSVPDSLAQPVGGWTAFEEYIVNNRKPVLPLNKKQVLPKPVELRFDVDQGGRPVNIVVTQSVSKESDEEAIRLLKEGPKWKGKKGTVSIQLTN